MFAQLGDIEFDLIAYLDGFNTWRKIDYAEHPIIEGKPKLQYIGESLETVAIRLSFHASFCDPEAELEALKDAASQYAPLAFIFANGVYKGKYVIEDIRDEVQQTFDDGTVIAVTVEVNLKEWDEEGAASKKKASIDASIAARPKKQTPDAVSEPNSISGGSEVLTEAEESFSMTGMSALSEVGAAIQIASDTVADIATAAANLTSFMRGFVSDYTTQALSLLGVDVEGTINTLRACLDPIDYAVSLIKEVTGGVLTELSSIFADARAIAFLVPMMQHIQEYRTLRDGVFATLGGIDRAIGTEMGISRMIVRQG